MVAFAVHFVFLVAVVNIFLKAEKNLVFIAYFLFFCLIVILVWVGSGGSFLLL